MDNRKRTIIISVLAVLLCVALAIGSTFAFFTDSVVNQNNKVKAGTLKVDLELLTDAANNTYTSIKTSQDPIFNYNLWEPGYTDVKIMRVENEGNLAIQWEAQLVCNEDLTKLADVIEVYVLNNGANAITSPENLEAVKSWTKAGTLKEFFTNAPSQLKGELQAATDANHPQYAYIAIALHLPTDIGGADVDDNEYQEVELPNFDIQILATQFASENDFFNNQYDEDATN